MTTSEKQLVSVTLDQKEYQALITAASFGMFIAVKLDESSEEEFLIGRRATQKACYGLGVERWNAMMGRMERVAEAAWESMRNAKVTQVGHNAFLKRTHD